MKPLLKILFFLLSIFYTSSVEAKVFISDAVVSEIEFTFYKVETKYTVWQKSRRETSSAIQRTIRYRRSRNLL
jgi:hypothetical protein